MLERIRSFEYGRAFGSIAILWIGMALFDGQLGYLLEGFAYSVGSENLLHIVLSAVFIFGAYWGVITLSASWYFCNRRSIRQSFLEELVLGLVCLVGFDILIIIENSFRDAFALGIFWMPLDITDSFVMIVSFMVLGRFARTVLSRSLG